jgi:crotonobetainyl-CoA:carnitine CoA-transferase CaiB-like acyl-CoA transferase
MSVWSSQPGAAVLDGLRVVDMTAGLAGPVATLFLAEAGAEVLKIEPSTGDLTRTTAAFATWNRSKGSMVLHLHDDSDRDRLDQLLAGADVFVHGLRPSVAAGHGLDDATLSVQFPQLIVSSIIGYPVGSDDEDRPGYDILVQARSGAMDETRGNRPGPIFLRLPLPSWSAAYLATAGIVARLIVRERTGRAGPAHTSLYQGMLSLLAMLWNRAERPSAVLLSKYPMAKDLPTSSHMLYECADGEWIQICGMYEELPLFGETQAELGFEPPEGKPAEAVYAQRCQVFRARSSHEWLEALHAYDCPVQLVRGLGDLLLDDDVCQNHYAIDLEDPVWGRVRQAGWPFTIEPPMTVRSPAPALGDHSPIRWDARETQIVHTEAVSLARPLEGLRVLDLGTHLAGPIAPMLMADLGAEVIKVERPSGDPMRQSEVLFLGCSRGKRSIALDLTRPESRPVIEALVRQADVVHHSIRMPAAAHLGLDEAGLRAINPDVVFCHISAYGPLGPRSGYPGYAPVAQAISGWHRETVGEGCHPIFYRFAMFDHFCGFASLVATLLAVLHRDRTGQATSVSASLVGGAAMTTSETMFKRDEATFAPFLRIDADQTGLDWGYRIYRAADGRWVAIAAVTADHRAALLREARVEDPSDLPDALERRSSTDLLAALARVEVPAELVRVEYEQPFFDDPAIVRTRLAVSYPQARYGTLEQPGAFWDLVDMELKLDVPPPDIGEHTVQVLCELGFTDVQVEALLMNGVAVGAAPDSTAG